MAGFLTFAVMPQNNIKQFRIARGLSQEALGDLIGTDKTQILRLEKGERRLTQEWMEKLATALKVSPADLIAKKPGAKSTHLAPQDILFEILDLVVEQVRSHPKLDNHVVIGIAKALYRRAASGKIPCPPKPKERAKLFRAEARNLIEYEVDKCD